MVDCGCVFVGHDVRKDLRILNLLVPPEQLIDTVELFRAKRPRKLSLRFLAQHLLGVQIQVRAHGVERYCTAVVGYCTAVAGYCMGYCTSAAGVLYRILYCSGMILYFLQ